MRNRNRERGNQTLEFTMIGIPLIFMLFSIANMCFAMLTLHTMQESVEQGARYVSTHGSTCSTGSNSCSITVQKIADVIAASASGISSSNLNITLIPASGTGNQISCSPLSSCVSTCSSGCSGSRSTVWPTSGSGDNSPGKDIIVSADCSVASPVFMYWPSGGTATNVNSANFHAYSRQRLMF